MATKLLDERMLTKEQVELAYGIFGQMLKERANSTSISSRDMRKYLEDSIDRALMKGPSPPSKRAYMAHRLKKIVEVKMKIMKANMIVMDHHP